MESHHTGQRRAGRPSAAADGDTKPCPQCRSALVFSSRYPVLAVGMIRGRSASASTIGDRIRYHQAWVCRNGGCVYRELVGDAF
jgi:hypothetical protein